jgi:hypothetical protein
MKCNGKCQLCKRLKAEDKKETKGLPAAKSLKQIMLFSYAKNKSQSYAMNDATQYASFYQNNFSSLHKPGIFHPPLG